MASDGRVLYLVYNADGSIMGKIRYGYRKVTCPKEGDPVCAACDITHGGLSLSETPTWTEAKKEIETLSNLKVVQSHRDELSPELIEYIRQHGIGLPVAVLGQPEGGFEVVMDRSALARCGGNARVFVKELSAKGLLERASL